MPEISIIVRTKNEERWIAHCLLMLYQQDYSDFEVILVDNASIDHTVQVAKRFPLAAVINIDKFLPGRALNEGIRASSGRFIVCLSAHCIPKNKDWLSCLRRNFDDDEKIALGKIIWSRDDITQIDNTIDAKLNEDAMDMLTRMGQDFLCKAARIGDPRPYLGRGKPRFSSKPVASKAASQRSLGAPNRTFRIQEEALRRVRELVRRLERIEKPESGHLPGG